MALSDLFLPMAQCSGYNGYCKMTGLSNVERGCCLDVLASSPPAPAIGGDSEIDFKPLVPR
ncbi:hypothetical protein J6590_047704 [Homalodisca vitripennis]|nr:hypothetical protein J6590_047704 [Homalodisca vitripennis]